MARHTATRRASASRRSTTTARTAVAERATDLELCLTLVRAVLSRHHLVISPARELVEDALARHEGTRVVRAVLSLASRVFSQQNELERVVLTAAQRAAKALVRARFHYRSLLRRHATARASEGAALNSCVDRARAYLESLSAEPTEIGIRTSGMWTKSDGGWGAERPGVRRVEPSEKLESGVRFSVAMAVGDEQS